MATAINTAVSAPRTLPVPTVYTRSSWYSDWTERIYLRVDSLELTAGPSINSAVLSREVGAMQPEEGVDFQIRSQLDIAGHYVKIEFTAESGGAVTWVGVIVGLAADRGGLDSHVFETGVVKNQRYECRGLAWLLDRRRITTSKINNDKTLGRGLVFNGGTGNLSPQDSARRHNRHSDRGNEGVYRFADQLSENLGSLGDTKIAELWDGAEILNYLFAYQTPQDTAESPVPPFKLDPSTANLLSWYEPTIPQDGRTALDVINQTVDRRRAICWSESFDASANRVLIKLHAMNADQIDLPSGGFIPASTQQVSVADLDTRVDIPLAFDVTDYARQFDQVIARGARRVAIFTISVPSEILETDWDTQRQDEFLAACDGVLANYEDLDVVEQASRNDEYRSTDKFQRVFSWYKIKSGWDFKTGSGEPSEAGTPICPKLDKVSGLPTGESEDLWLPGLRLLGTLPLLTDHDYETFEKPEDIEDATPEGSVAQYRRPFGVLKIEDDTSKEAYQYLDQLATGAGSNEMLGGGLTVNAHLSMQHNAPGIIVRANGPAHKLAKTIWEEGEPAESDVTPELDLDSLRVTVACECDHHVEGKFPIMASPAGDAARVLVLNLERLGRLDYVNPQTVVEVKTGKLVKSSGGFIRDDRLLLDDIAYVAWAWYQTPRRAIEITYKQITAAYQIGDLITTIGFGATAETINSVVTTIRWDFTQGRGTTTIKTSFAELDIGGLV